MYDGVAREKRRKYREREKEKELKVAKTTDTTQGKTKFNTHTVV